jgi:hypothetical protein
LEGKLAQNELEQRAILFAEQNFRSPFLNEGQRVQGRVTGENGLLNILRPVKVDQL